MGGGGYGPEASSRALDRWGLGEGLSFHLYHSLVHLNPKTVQIPPLT